MTFLFAGTLMIASCDTQLRPLCVLSLTVCLSFSYFTVWLRVISYDWYPRETVDKSPRFLSMIWGSLTLGLCNIRRGGCVGWARVQLSAPALEDFPWGFSLRASPTSTLTILGNKSEHIDLWVIGKTTAKWGILATCLLTLFMSRILLFYSTSSIWPTCSWAFTIFFFMMI